MWYIAHKMEGITCAQVVFIRSQRQFELAFQNIAEFLARVGNLLAAARLWFENMHVRLQQPSVARNDDALELDPATLPPAAGLATGVMA